MPTISPTGKLGVLHDTLKRSFTAPFSLLDIAGDASQMRALAGTEIRHYHGVDLSESALELAANNLKDMPFEVELDHRDFVDAITRRPEPADVAWCSLSIHHLDTDGKLRLMQALRDSTQRLSHDLRADAGRWRDPRCVS